MPIRVGEGGRLADDSADDRVEDDDDAAEEGRVRGGDRPVLRQRRQAVEAISQTETLHKGRDQPPLKLRRSAGALA